jgi:pimeloyl-ACP methyl ester carboxylesterase
VEIPNAGHNVALHNPEAVADELARFLVQGCVPGSRARTLE